MFFPINKALWSSSFVLVTAGWATLILAIFYYILDVKKIQFGSVFKYVGMNAITIFFLSSFISKIFYMTPFRDTNIHSFLFKNVFVSTLYEDKMASLFYAITVVVFYILVAYFLYRKKIFIKV